MSYSNTSSAYPSSVCYGYDTKAKGKAKARMSPVDDDNFHDSGFCSAVEPSDSSSSPSPLKTPQSENLPLPIPFPSTPCHDVRTYSAGTQTQRPRRISRLSITSTVSTKITLDLFKTTPASAIPCATLEHTSMGAFSPTGSAESHLRRLVGGRPKPESQIMQRTRTPPATWSAPRLTKPWTRSHRSIPSISRSPSPSVTGSSSPPPPTPAILTRHSSSSALSTPLRMDPLLAALESASRLRARVVCVACHKTGSDFPRCPRCGDAWCSRQCRTVGNQGAKHVCRTRYS